MTIPEYLAATGQSANGFSRASGIPQSTLQHIMSRGGACRVDVAGWLVEESKRRPALSRANGRPLAEGHITFEDLAFGAAAFHKAKPPRRKPKKARKRRAGAKRRAAK